MTESIIPGIYPCMTAATYFADPCPAPSLTQSISKILLGKSPAHARLAHPRLNPDWQPETGEYTAATAIGNAAHKLLLGRGRDVVPVEITDKKTGEVIEVKNFLTDQAKDVRDALYAEGKIPILAKHHAVAATMVAAAREQLDARGYVDAFVWGSAEVALIWREGSFDDGLELWFRSLVDWLSSTCEVWDYKTTGLSCAPHVVAERPSEQDWDLQGAMIERGLDALDPDNAGRRTFRFVVQENFEPFALTVVELSEADLTIGRKKLAMAADMWAPCLLSGVWPRYPIYTVMSRPKPWLEARFLEREIAEAAAQRMPGKFDPQVVMAG